MKKSFLFLLLIFSYLGMSSTTKEEKKYRDFIEKHDVPSIAKDTCRENPAAFWSLSLSGNLDLNTFLKDIRKNKGAEKEALLEYSKLPHFYAAVNQSVIEELQGFCDTLLLNMGTMPKDLKCSLHILHSDEIRTFSAPTDDGFAICITSSLFSWKGMNTSVLKGYVAHEFAHGVLKHKLRKLYADAKQRRKDKVVGGVLLGAVVAAAVGMEAALPGDCHDDDNFVEEQYRYEKYVDALDKIKDKPKLKTVQYNFNYTDDQIREADLYAYRFMQNIGIGDDYITGLEILGSAYEESKNIFDYNPGIPSRINFIRYIKDHPLMGKRFKVKANPAD